MVKPSFLSGFCTWIVREGRQELGPSSRIVNAKIWAFDTNSRAVGASRISLVSWQRFHLLWRNVNSEIRMLVPTSACPRSPAQPGVIKPA